MTDTKTRVLHAAASVVREKGAGALTLDAVAVEAGVSKGGLLYHFPSKRALVDAMVRRRAVDFIEAVEERQGNGATGPVQAYVSACFDEPPTTLDTAILAGVVEDPAIAETYREAVAGLQSRVDDAGDPILAAIVRLAADGLWLSEMLGIDTTDTQTRAAVADRLRELARQAEAR